ncbi:MAG TPA: ATP-dependent helicase, partial [Anaeromyxobacteraceae bacterium]|nr:ATP-dependent helicase [Anaeromyxobacteraceae bacterium]
RQTRFEVARGAAEAFQEAAAKTDPRAPGVRIDPWRGPPPVDRPAHAARPHAARPHGARSGTGHRESGGEGGHRTPARKGPRR